LDLDPPPRELYCQLCLVRLARRHIAVPSPSGRLERADYCASCYEAKYEKPPPAGVRFPWPRFTIKAIMILVCVFAVFNAFTALLMRGSSVTGTPEQLDERDTHFFLGANVEIGFFLAWAYLLQWLMKVRWYKRTGGLVPMPEPPPVQFGMQEWRTASERERVLVCLGIAVAPAWALTSKIYGWEFRPSLYAAGVLEFAIMAALAFSARRR
jgi:hypothetical protein